MSLRHANQPQFPQRGLREGPAAPWVRPADWPELPWILDSEQAIVGLLAVYDTDQEKVAISCAGNYTVDWGDGSAAENFSSGAVAQHTYAYSTLGSRLTSRGYKTAIVKATPQVGQNLTSINLQHKPTGLNAYHLPAPWLDVQVNAQYASTISIGGTTRYVNALERIHIRANAVTSPGLFAYQLRNLKSLTFSGTAALTYIPSTFDGLTSISEFPLCEFPNVTDAIGAFANNATITSYLPLNFAKATTLRFLFRYNYALKYSPPINAPLATSLYGMFEVCSSLILIDTIDCSSVTNLDAFVNGCHALARCKITGVKVTHSYADCSLPATAIDEIFTNLASGVTGQTITVTGNPGAATCTPSIATAKGWTVVT